MPFSLLLVKIEQLGAGYSIRYDYFHREHWNSILSWWQQQQQHRKITTYPTICYHNCCNSLNELFQEVSVACNPPGWKWMRKITRMVFHSTETEWKYRLESWQRSKEITSADVFACRLSKVGSWEKKKIDSIYFPFCIFAYLYRWHVSSSVFMRVPEVSTMLCIMYVM